MKSLSKEAKLEIKLDVEQLKNLDVFSLPPELEEKMKKVVEETIMGSWTISNLGRYSVSGSASSFFPGATSSNKDADAIYFWKRHYLYRHVSDEEGLEVYSIVERALWDGGIRSVNENTDIYLPWVAHLPKDVFEEVAANWFELLGEEADLPEYIKVVV